MHRLRLTFRGLVQGVGFRPFIFTTAKRFALTGWVQNVGWGVQSEWQGDLRSVARALAFVIRHLPAAASLDLVTRRMVPCRSEEDGFLILSSLQDIPDTIIPPDMAVCKNCLREFEDRENRHFQNFFIGCTDCGPRYSVLQSLPYDRERTVMSEFPFCNSCNEEYLRPGNRRFHAQSTTCPDCGPRYRLVYPAVGMANERTDAELICLAAKAIIEGKIVALKGIGGFHLLCDPLQKESVARLAGAKGRNGKPMALVASSIQALGHICKVSCDERKIFESTRAPILLLTLNENPFPQINDDLKYIGIMRAYTPALQQLLDLTQRDFLVATSANMSGLPTIIDDQEACGRLIGLADLIIGHNRLIVARADDSVGFYEEGFLLTRPGRGYAPLSWPCRFTGQERILALGAQEKAAIAILNRGKITLSPHVGDLDTLETSDAYRWTVAHFRSLFAFDPTVVLCDKHPDFITTHLAEELQKEFGAKIIRIQHHRAHVSSAMFESGFKKCIGFAFDGTGYGDDGAIWGGEAFLADGSRMKRIFHLEYYPLVSGEQAIKEPLRLLYYFLRTMNLPEADVWAAKEPRLEQSYRGSKLFSYPLASSMGRLFDVAAVLVGCGSRNDYEARLPMHLESLVDNSENGQYDWEIRESTHWTVSPMELIANMAKDIRKGVSANRVAARFHNTLGQTITDVATLARDRYGIDQVVLSGGVFQNRILLQRAKESLRKKGFLVRHNHLVPINDGGIGVGQIIHYIEGLEEG